MRTSITTALVLAGLAVVAPPAMAADQTVRASGPLLGDYGESPATFSPSTVNISPGESVTFVNDNGTHNVRFDDGLFTSPSTPMLPAGWPSPPAKRTFPEAGSYRFVCDLHGSSGMTGRVVVGTTTGGGGTGGGDGGGTTDPTPPGTTPAAVKIESASMAGRRFCTKKSRRCRRPGVRLTVDLSKAAKLTGTLRRRPLRGSRHARRFGTVDFGTVAAGRRQLRFTRTKSRRRLTSGRYTLTLKAGDSTRLLRFSVTS